MLFNKKDIKFYMRFYLKKLLFLEHGHIQKGDHKILSLINFKDDKNFQFIDYSLFKSNKVKKILYKLSLKTKNQENTIIQLLSGDEPLVGDDNYFDVKKYAESHIQGVIEIMKRFNLATAQIWLKEHKSYKPLSKLDKKYLQNFLAK